MVRRMHGDGAGMAGSDAAGRDPRQGGGEPYPGFSQGLPYVPTTEKDMFWAPESAPRSDRTGEGGSENRCGIGITLVFDAAIKTLVVEAVAPGGPAARSGLMQPGDIVAEVDGINVTGQPLDIVESLLHGVSVTALPASPARCRAALLAAALAARFSDAQARTRAHACARLLRGRAR